MSAIQLASGKFFDFDTATPSDIVISDIAASLSKLCRYTGHCREFYSVAQHSVIVSLMVPTLEALLHDATEAYMNDLSRPVKQRNPAYIAQEHALWPVIADRFGLMYKLPRAIKDADNRALMAERRDLMPQGDPAYERAWLMGIPPDLTPFPDRIVPWEPRFAQRAFLIRYYALERRRNAGL